MDQSYPRSRHATMRLAFVVLSLTSASALNAQASPAAPPTDTLSLRRLAAEARQGPTAQATPVRARVMAADGRMLVTRGAIAWLADSTSRDSSVFLVSVSQS